MPGKTVFLFGYSGHAWVIADSILASADTLGGYFDIAESSRNPFDLKWLGFERAAPVRQLCAGGLVFPALGDNSIRRKLVALFESMALEQHTVIDPFAVVSPRATVAKSTFVGRNAVINPLASVGRGAIINTAAVVEHECRIGDFAHVGPNATLSGDVQVGQGSFVGAGAVVRQQIRIGANSIVGAGSVVVKDIPDNQIWVGNPARFLKFTDE